ANSHPFANGYVFKSICLSNFPMYNTGGSFSCSYAPTDNALFEVAGAPTVQRVGPAFPLATTTATPSSDALLTALLVGYSGPLTVFPSDKLTTSTSSRIACTSAAII